jgi:hypothetical protein
MTDMTDPQDQPSPDGHNVSDNDTLRQSEDHDEIDMTIDEDPEPPIGTPDPISNGQVSRRYREILRDRVEDGSEESSIDAAPRRVGSPIDSLLSVPDDTPSIQVCSPGPPARQGKARQSGALTRCT